MKKTLKISSFFAFFLLIFFFSVSTTTAEDSITWRSHSSALKNKSWTITLSKEIDKSTVTTHSVKVMNSSGEYMNVTTEILNDNKSIKVTPVENYIPDNYTLIINESLKSTDGENLKTQVKLPFVITDFKLGNENLMDKYLEVIKGKKVGLVTNQTGIDSSGILTMDKLYNNTAVELTALFAPEHGLDGIISAGEDVATYVHETYNIPVYGLHYNNLRKPTSEMLENIDVLIFDIQHIGSRSYTFKSTLYLCMVAAKENNKPIIVLDRPNPLGGLLVEGPILDETFSSFIGIDSIPVIHGMSLGELAYYYNREIYADLKVVPMSGYKRDMIFSDTGLDWVQTSPYIPTLDAAFKYSATGLGDGTGIGQSDYFSWVGGKDIVSLEFADILNSYNLPGVEFIPMDKGSRGGVTLHITDYYSFNPFITSMHILCVGKSLTNFEVPLSKLPSEKWDDICTFDKIMGTNEIGNLLRQNVSPNEIIKSYRNELNIFKKEREKYLIPNYNVN